MNRLKFTGAVKLSPLDKVEIYFNDIIIGNGEIRILEGCKSISMRWKESVEFADRKVSTGEWNSYVIPALTGSKVIFSDGEYHTKENGNGKDYVKCPNCGNEEEDLGNDFLMDSFTYTGTEDNTVHYMCNECLTEVEHKID